MSAITTKSAGETKKMARMLAQEIAARPDSVGTRGATVLALSGELGAGKTTFVQGFAAALGVKEKIKSPTFVLMKVYGLPPRIKDKSKPRPFRLKGRGKKIKEKGGTSCRLIHIDCYRIQNSKNLLHLGLKEILRDRDAIVIIEWADRIKKILPRGSLWLKFRHGTKQNERHLSFRSE